MTPSELGYVKCKFCKTQRPEAALLNGVCRGEFYVFCTREAERHDPMSLASGVGWDANGAPTGIDANGDAL